MLGTIFGIIVVIVLANFFVDSIRYKTGIMSEEEIEKYKEKEKRDAEWVERNKDEDK